MTLPLRLICVAALFAGIPAWAVADTEPAQRGAPSRPDVQIAKGPYLQSLGPTSVEIRVELTQPAPAAIAISGPEGGAPPNVVRDDAAKAMHVWRVEGLVPRTHYSYSLKVSTSAAAGEFITGPPADSRDPFTVLLYGDNRTDDVAHAGVIRAMLQAPSDFVINTGDLVEDGSSALNWQSFFEIEAPLLRSRCVFACVGNHELRDGASSGYLGYFGPTSDTRGAEQKPKLYGSFRWGSARFFLLDAMESFGPGPERSWLEAEFARADDEPGLSWRIAVMHHSPWSAGPHGGNPRALQASLPALFSQHHVDLVLAGHDHIYERGFASGIGYIISGGGGAPLYSIAHLPESTRKAEAVHHFVELTFAVDAVHVVAEREDGTLIERCGLTKGATTDRWDCDPASSPTPSGPPASRPVSAAKCACDAVGARVAAPLGLLPAFVVILGASLRRSRARWNRG